MTLFWEIVAFSLLGGVLSTVGGILLLSRPEKLRRASFWLLAFAAGTLLAVACFDLLPEALENAEAVGVSGGAVFQALFAGLVGLFVLEGLLFRIHHHHDDSLITDPEHPHRAEPLHTPVLLLVGDTMHNFIDGVVIGASFLAGAPVGFLATLAVAAHEVPQEISEFGVMAAAGWSRARIIAVNIGSALMSTLGAVLTYFYRDALYHNLWAMMAFAAGLFMYIAVADIMPQLYEEHGRRKVWKILAVFLSGAVLVYVLGILVHGEEHVDEEVPLYAVAVER